MHPDPPPSFRLQLAIPARSNQAGCLCPPSPVPDHSGIFHLLNPESLLLSVLHLAGGGDGELKQGPVPKQILFVRGGC